MGHEADQTFIMMFLLNAKKEDRTTEGGRGRGSGGKEEGNEGNRQKEEQKDRTTERH